MAAHLDFLSMCCLLFIVVQNMHVISC